MRMFERQYVWKESNDPDLHQVSAGFIILHEVINKWGTEDCKAPQEDFYRSYKWSQDWEMKFKAKKCKSLERGNV